MIIKLNFYFFIFSAVFCQGLYAQQNDYDTSSILKKSPVRIVAHTDSSLFMIGKKAYAKGKFDLYISKHTAYKNTIDFERSLYLSKVFTGGFNPDNFKYEVFQCEDNMVVIFDAIIGNNKTIIAKTMDYNGVLSLAFIVDELDIAAPNFMRSEYEYALTSKNEILITIKRIYKSGYQRDKCILIDGHLKKLWDYEFPKINSHIETNVVANVYNSSQLIYVVTNDSIGSRETKRDLKSITDTIIKRDVDGLKYDLRIRTDTLSIFVAFPLKNELKTIKVYWPFLTFPTITPLSASQFMFYDLLDIDDEKHMIPGKKAFFYKRIDIRSNTVLYEKLIPLDRRTQDNLTYFSGESSKGSTHKGFGLIVEKLIEGKLFSVFEHMAFDDSELVVSCFNIADNKFEWTHLLPRRLSTKSTLYDLTVSYSKKQLNLAYYENKLNIETPLNQYRHKKYKIARNYTQSNFIQFTINENGIPVKSIINKASESFLFPWLSEPSGVSDPHFFQSRAFLPINYLYKSNK